MTVYAGGNKGEEMNYSYAYGAYGDIGHHRHFYGSDCWKADNAPYWQIPR